MQNQLRKINSEIRQREAYLLLVNKQIEEAINIGSQSMRDLQGEVENLEKEKARLLKQLISIRQQIRLEVEYKKGKNPI